MAREYLHFLVTALLSCYPYCSRGRSKKGYTLSDMIELTMSLSFSFNALMAFLRDTPAWVWTSSMSLSSMPVASTSSSSSSSSSFLAPSSAPWSWS